MLNNAAEAYWFVMNHPKLLYKECIDPWFEITPHMVNEKGFVSENEEENTILEWWIECGPYVDDKHFGLIPFHDYELDCGGRTAEDAVMKLAILVKEKYGDYE